MQAAVEERERKHGVSVNVNVRSAGKSRGKACKQPKHTQSALKGIPLSIHHPNNTRKKKKRGRKKTPLEEEAIAALALTCNVRVRKLAVCGDR